MKLWEHLPLFSLSSLRTFILQSQGESDGANNKSDATTASLVYNKWCLFFYCFCVSPQEESFIFFCSILLLPFLVCKWLSKGLLYCRPYLGSKYRSAERETVEQQNTPHLAEWLWYAMRYKAQSIVCDTWLLVNITFSKVLTTCFMVSKRLISRYKKNLSISSNVFRYACVFKTSI